MAIDLTPVDPRPVTSDELGHFLIAYLTLSHARYLAAAEQVHPHARPVSYPHLQQHGVDAGFLVWLQFQGHVEHLQPDTASPHGYRIVDCIHFNDTSGVVLTDAGQEASEAFLAAMLEADDQAAFNVVRARFVVGHLLPRFDPNDRQFTWGAHLLKWFRQPAPFQELILLSAQEQGWQSPLDDPLPRQTGKNPKVVLHTTLQNLNRRCRRSFIRFGGDGSGRGFRWWPG